MLMMARKLDINTNMKFKIIGKNKTQTFNVDPTNRYKVQGKEHVLKRDWDQFWTYVKYELNVDYNSVKKIIALKPAQLKKLQKHWGDKFRFEK